MSNIIPRLVICIIKVAMTEFKRPTSRQVVDQAVKAEKATVAHGEKLYHFTQPWFSTHTGGEEAGEWSGPNDGPWDGRSR